MRITKAGYDDDEILEMGRGDLLKILMPSIHLRPVTRVRHKEERWVAFSQILYPPWILTAHTHANAAFIAILC